MQTCTFIWGALFIEIKWEPDKSPEVRFCTNYGTTLQHCFSQLLVRGRRCGRKEGRKEVDTE